MKSLALIALFFSVNSFAMSTYTHCQSIRLAKDYQELELQVSKESVLDLETNFDMAVLSKDGDTVEVKGLKVEAQKITAVDTFTKHHWGLGGGATTRTKVFAVKFHVSALESIGTEIQGCIPREIKELDAYTICEESLTIMSRE